MNYYEDEQNVTQYSKFTPAHDGTLLVDALGEHLPEGSTVLELGMGPGKDLQLLSQHFKVTGSDFSRLFLEKYRAQHESADLLHLDARTLDTERTFDAIFSNKALIHLSADELQQSFKRQHALLNDNGLVLHSFWYGEGQKEFGGLTLVYHNEQDLAAMLAPGFDILALKRHAKMAEGDSIYVVARRK
jgi:cyclopropane fatty-acyl-phospholipid synthase-like methyltransferase